MSPRDLVYVGHMLDMTRKAVSKVQGISRTDYDVDENIGEMIDKLPPCGRHDHMARRATVGARELKTRLGGYLQQVRQGRTLVITDRGEPVAELKPIERIGAEDARLGQLQALGTVTRLENRPLAPFRPVRSHGPSVSDAIIDDRVDRV